MKIVRNKWFWISLPLLLVVLAFSLSDSVRRYAFYGPALITAASSKLACSGVYMMGRSPDEVILRDVNPFNPAMKFADLTFDNQQKIVKATLFGFAERWSIYRPGVGCSVVIDATPAEMLTQASKLHEADRSPRPQEWPLGDEVSIESGGQFLDRALLEKSIDAAFADDTDNKTIDTRAIVVVYDGKIVAERYADGFDRNSRFLSWSASKSIISALIGTMVSDGKLDLNGRAPVPEWAAPEDPRHQIKLHHMLTMTTGLAFDEAYIPGNDSTTMLFSTAHMGDYAASKPLYKKPGTLWAYSSGTTNILARILFDESGGSLASLHDYAWRHLFGPVGMNSAIFEPDASGSFVGSSFFYASARDFARFGLLFLNRGKVGEKQVLSEEWVNFSRTPTPLAPQGKYGAQFWLNGGHPERDEGLMMPDLPRDTFMALGFNDEIVAIVPSRKAVVVRLGWTTCCKRFDTNGRFAEILAALPTN